MKKLILLTTEEQIFEIEKLAKEIYLEYYSKILPVEFVKYWVEVYQNKKNIKKSLENGEIYYFIYEEEEVAGYLSYVIDKVNSTLFISKFYLKEKFRGKKLGSFAFDEIMKVAKQEGVTKIWLKTLRANPSVEVYKKLGFTIEKRVETDIGGNHILEDYVLSKNLK